MSGTPMTDAKTQFYRLNPEKREEFPIVDFARSLERENAALRQDKKRLDWLLAQVNNGVCFEHYDRAAIDAARAKEGGAS